MTAKSSCKLQQQQQQNIHYIRHNNSVIIPSNLANSHFIIIFALP